MDFDYYPFRKRTLRLISLLSLAALVGCSSGTLSTESSQSSADTAAPVAVDDISPATAEEAQTFPVSPIRTQRRPQLIKHASLRIELADIDEAIEDISGILTQYQGDLLELSDQENQSDSSRQVWVELRVPQSNFDALLEQLRAVGTIQEQSITAEDVSTQLVDLQARIRNLRKSEEALLEIMERSGSIPDVLEVTRELNTVRENIERMDAQLKDLQNRVAYSTISLILLSSQVPQPPTSPVGETLNLTWQTATSSMRSLSVGLLQLLLWLLVFSPYIAILVLGGWAGRRYWQRQRVS